MGFAFRMAWRDSRASRRRLLFFSLPISLGIAVLVALGSFSASLAESVHAQAKGLLGADLVITSRAPIGADVAAYLDSLGATRASDVAMSSMMTFPTDGGAVRLVQVRGMEGAFPFYGELETQPADAAQRFQKAGPDAAVAILEDTLMSQFNVRVGDPVMLGNSTYTVIGALKKLPGESTVFAMLAPRALVRMDSLAAAGLDQPRILVRYRTTLMLPDARDADTVVRDIRGKFPHSQFGFETTEERQRQLGRAITNIYGFLSLVGFIALLLGSVGVAGAVQVYIRQKISTVAVLRCLGAGSWQSFAIYLTQAGALGLAGAIIGGALGLGIQLAMPALLQGILPFPVEYSVSWPAVCRGTGTGVAVCLLFTLLPLLAIRRVSPLAALRAGSERQGWSAPDPLVSAACCAIAAAVVGFAVWQTHSRLLGISFAIALGLGLGVLAGLAAFVAAVARAWSARRGWLALPYVARQGIANLHRPGNRTVLLLVSLGLGTFLVMTLFLVRTAFINAIHEVDPSRQANLAFLDVQDDQVGALDRLLEGAGVAIARQAPLVSMRLSAVKGVPVEQLLGNRGERRSGWGLRREYRSTFRDRLDDTETIVAGSFVGRVKPGEAEVPISIDEALARELQLSVGDMLEWNVQGITVATQVSSIRRIDERRMEFGFAAVFPVGSLDAAPKTWVVAVHAADAASSAGLQGRVSRAFPNVTAIDVALVLQTFESIFSKVEFVIEFMAFFTVATGLVVLAGAVVSGRYHRLRELVLLRTLGASRRQLVRIQLIEHGVLGVLAALVGCMLSIAASTLLARHVFGLSPGAPLLAVAVAVASVAVLTLATGWLADRGALGRPPLEALREDAS